MADIQLIIFRDEKCPKCRTVKPIFEKFLEKHKEITKNILYFEKHREFFHYFHIEKLPAFVVRQNGRNVLKYEGLIDYETLEYIFKEKIKCI